MKKYIIIRDEGFHQLLIGKWDNDLRFNILFIEINLTKVILNLDLFSQNLFGE